MFSKNTFSPLFLFIIIILCTTHKNHASQERPTTHDLIVYQKNGNETELLTRTIYHWAPQKELTLEYPIQIAPEEFCKKIAAIVSRYNIAQPVIPVTDTTIPELNTYSINAASDLDNHFIYFSKNYTEQEEPQFLRALLGHELAHRNYNTPEHQKICNLNRHLRTSLCLALCLGFSLQFFPPLFRDTFILYGVRSFFSGLAAYLLFSSQPSITQWHQVELGCDVCAVMFGETYQDKIEIAKESIEYFKYNQQKESKLQKLQNWLAQYINNFHKPHPSIQNRIDHLEKVMSALEELEKQRLKRLYPEYRWETE